MSGKIHDGYFVSTKSHLALTFTDAKKRTATAECGNTALLQSDQGVLVEFLTDVPENFTNIADKVAESVEFDMPNETTPLTAATTILTALIQEVAEHSEETAKLAFWNSYSYS